MQLLQVHMSTSMNCCKICTLLHLWQWWPISASNFWDTRRAGIPLPAQAAHQGTLFPKGNAPRRRSCGHPVVLRLSQENSVLTTQLWKREEPLLRLLNKECGTFIHPTVFHSMHWHAHYAYSLLSEHFQLIWYCIDHVILLPATAVYFSNQRVWSSDEARVQLTQLETVE